jgi:hypothetical protein
MIAVRLGRDPYGFIGKFQGLSCTWDTAALTIAKLLINDPRVFAAYLVALGKSPSFDWSNQLAGVLPAVRGLSEQQVKALVDVYNSNFEVRGSFGFNGGKPSVYGPGLQAHLKRWTGNDYFVGTEGELFYF